MSKRFCRFFCYFICVFLLRIEFGVIPSSKMDRCLRELIFNSGGWYYFYLKIFFSILFYKTFPNSKVSDIILERVGHTFVVKENGPNALEEVFLTFNFVLFFISFYGGVKTMLYPLVLLWWGYSTCVQENTICTSWWVLSYYHMLLWISLMKRWILEYLHLFLLFTINLFIFLYISNFIYIYIFIHSFLPGIVQL
jgi:hypothetical protein